VPGAVFVNGRILAGEYGYCRYNKWFRLVGCGEHAGKNNHSWRVDGWEGGCFSFLCLLGPGAQKARWPFGGLVE